MASLQRPVIGLTTQTLHSIDGIPPALPSSWVMNQRYFLAATMVGAVPWMIPLLDDDLLTLREIYERLDGLLIPGGVDINPAEYGEAVRPECGNLDPARDRVGSRFVGYIIARAWRFFRAAHLQGSPAGISDGVDRRLDPDRQNRR